MRSLGERIGYPPRLRRLPLHCSVLISQDSGTDFKLGDTILVVGFAAWTRDHEVELDVKVRFGEDDD